MSDQEQERAVFESYILQDRGQEYLLTFVGDDNYQEYVNDYVQEAWESWQAGRASMQAVNPVAVAWTFPLRYGSAVRFAKPEKPAEWDDDENEWYCQPLGVIGAPVVVPDGLDDKLHIVQCSFNTGSESHKAVVECRRIIAALLEGK